MALLVNLRHLERKDLHLEGDLSPDELEIRDLDDLISASQPMRYSLEVQKLDQSILVQGRLELTLDCQCVRCLKSFRHSLELNGWVCNLELQGEEAVVVSNDCVDLTPFVREDILLAFPQHPLCKPECGGLPKSVIRRAKKAAGTELAETNSAAWAELNKLKL